MTPGTAYVLIASVLALATLMMGAIGVWGGGIGREIRLLKDRVATLEGQLADCESARRRLVEENLDLMRRYIRLKNGERT